MMKNCVDPDQSWLHQKPADVDLHIFQRGSRILKKLSAQCN